MMSSVEAAWLAGLFDGEGCIGFVDDNTVSLAVAMTDEDVVRRIQSVTGTGTVVFVPKRDGHKPQWRWSIAKKQDVARLLCAMAPMLGERRRAKALEAAERLSRFRHRQIPAACGTLGGYAAHRRRHEQPCRDCWQANSEDCRRRYVERKKRSLTS